ncbi:hypothetical protein KAR91_08300 [Candidatus Pacearchaeota archaeon]|nr:hypothetical protein [Candidatus Pacearchaeota archaeon]
MKNDKAADAAKGAKKKEKEDNKAAEKKAKDEAKAALKKKKDKEAAAAKKREDEIEAAKKLPTAKGHYVAKGKAVVCNRKGYLVNGAPVKPEWFDNKKDFDKFVKSGHIIKV